MSKKVLVLGAGLVCAPGVQYLSEKGCAVTVASRTVAKAEKITKGLKGCTAVAIDVGDVSQRDALDKLMADTDIVVSLVPWTMHTIVCELAVKHKIHFASTSYISDDMMNLSDSFKTNGKICFNECGVDPGLDHMSAQKVFDEVHAKGGKIIKFLSYCGGLPCPDDNNNPFGYKFSWSPRGVLLAAVREAFYLEDGAEKKLDKTPGQGIYDHFIVDSSVPNVGIPLEKATWPEGFECHPNGNSTKFRPIYNIPECQTLVRGTYRTLGWCESMRAIKNLGLLDETPCADELADKTMAQLIASLCGCDVANIKAEAAKKIGVEVTHKIIENLDWLGLFSETTPAKAPTKLDAVCNLFENNPKFWYAEGERDMIAMHHTFKVENADGSKQTITSTMVEYGHKDGETAMARTVTQPVAIAINKILTGEITDVGVVRPTTKDLYTKILAEMETLGVKFVENTTDGW
eukprot:m.223210 g.223210  ORF g.223210 m.223210 type:complete len:461 (+) comp33391_c5_seq6:66-1448(+)